MTQSIFISSSGDLRDLRKRLHDDLHDWLEQRGLGHLMKPYLWEEEKEDGRLFSDRQRIQSQLPDPGSWEVALTICLFGERCGSPLEDELDPSVIRRFDDWRAEDQGPGLLHPWPSDPEAQHRALANGQYPLTGTVYELLSAHAQPEEADNLIVACCASAPVAPETKAEDVVFNGHRLYSRLTEGQPQRERRRIEAEIYNPQTAALLNLLKQHARTVKFVQTYPNENAMCREVLKIAQRRLCEKLGIASLRNHFKENLVHWTIEDEKLLPGRSGIIKEVLGEMQKKRSLFLLTGRSGCGKSSLMQSGIMRRLHEIDGSVLVPFRPAELMAGSDEGDALDKLANLIAQSAGLHFQTGGPKAMRPVNYATRLCKELEHKHIKLVLGLDQFEEIIDDLKMERERSNGTPEQGWWLVIRFLKALCGSPRVRMIATLESARETSFHALKIGEAIGLPYTTKNAEATDDTIAEIARSGFSLGGLPLDPDLVEAIKRKWRSFEKQIQDNNTSPLPLACLYFHELYEKFSDRAGTTADERSELGNAFQKAGSSESDRLLTLEDIGGEDAIAFEHLIQRLADEAWRAGGGNPDFADPIEKSKDFIGLNNFLRPLVTVDNGGAIQLRAPAEGDADHSTLRMRSAFRERRLLVSIPAQGPPRVRLAHQALIDRWSPAKRWYKYRKQYLLAIQRFRDDVGYWKSRGKSVPLQEDGSTLRAAALTLSQHSLDWLMHRGGLDPADADLRDEALAIFDTAKDPLIHVEGSPFLSTYAHLAAAYHRVDLLRRFIATKPECLKVEDNTGSNLLHSAAWSDGPAVPFLIEMGVPLSSEKAPWNAIAATISEKQNGNFNAMIGQIGLDDPIETSQKTRMIHYAARHGNMYVIEHLVKHGATLDLPDEWGRTALTYAAELNQVEAFCDLRKHINIQKHDEWKNTAISQAAMFGSANVLSAYSDGEHSHEQLTIVLQHRNRHGDTPLMLAARNRQTEALRVLLKPELRELGDPSSPAHRGENGDNLFHVVFRGNYAEKMTDTDRFRARAAIELLLDDGRLDPNLKNKNGETPFDIGKAFPEAKGVLREDNRVPKVYAEMDVAIRIEDLSSRRSAIVMRLLNEAPQALTEVHKHKQSSERSAHVSMPPNGKPRAEAKAYEGETGLDILIRVKNHAVLATLVADETFWPALRKEFQKLLRVAEVPSADRLRSALLGRFFTHEIDVKQAGELLGACLNAEDVQTARSLAVHGATVALRRDGEGSTVLHHAAITGDTERFRAVLTVGRFGLPRDNWGRRPSELAAEAQADAFRALEAEMGKSTRKRSPQTVSSSIAELPPFLSLEREGAARPAAETEMQMLKRSWNEEWGDIGGVEVRAFHLPFHPNAPLIEVRPHASTARRGRLCFLLHGDSLYRLNATSPPIHEVNGKETPLINDETVLQYLAFFCFFVRSEHGPFLVVDRLDNEFLPDLGAHKDDMANAFRPLRLWGKNKKGDWLVSGLVYYSNALYFASFSVDPAGMVMMNSDTLVLADLPASIDAPLDIRSIH